jgi:outer membrane biosynthesis protein TonB
MSTQREREHGRTPAPVGADGADFKALVADILADPERINDESISPEQVLELQKLLNPYAPYIPEDAGDAGHKRSVAASCTNLRALYLQRFTMTALVGFLFRVADEWEVPEEVRRWVSPTKAARDKQKLGERRAAAPYTCDELVARTTALQELAQLAKTAADEATEACRAAIEADGGAAPPPPEAPKAEPADAAETETPEGPVASPAASPAAEPKASPAASPAAEPKAEPAAEPKAEPKAEPADAAETETAEEPEVGPEGAAETGTPEAPGGAASGASGASEETAAGLYRKADAAQARARGLLYAAAFELRKLGLEADDRIDATAAVARQHPEVAAIIAADPIRRPEPGQAEMPAQAAKEVVQAFLRAWFEYNPDAHVRSAYDEFVIETERVEVEGLGAVPADKGDPERLPLAAIRAEALRGGSADDRAAVEALTSSRRAHSAAALALRDRGVAAALARALEAPDKFRRLLCPVPAGSPARAAVEVIPPQDTFHRWQYYMEVNYEELRAATEAIYHEKPDLDWALILYEYFEGGEAEVEAAFEAFRDKHQDEIVTDIKGIDFGQWTLLGDFKGNREKITFYNKHTEILKRILDRHAEDKKLGADLMRHRVRRLKAKNIREAGPDAPGLAEYKSENAAKGLAALGGETVIGREEMLRLERARGDLRAAKELEVIDQSRQTIADLSAAAKVRALLPEEERRLREAQEDIVRAKEMLEVPDDAIQVDVWTHDTSAGSFGKTRFYTKAEPPSHIPAIQGEQAAALGRRGERAPPPPSPQGAEAARQRQANIALPAGATQTRAHDLAPFAQTILAKEIARGRGPPEPGGGGEGGASGAAK